MELKPYAPEYFDKLLRFIQKEYPERNRIEELLRYRLYHLPPKETDWQQNAIIVDDNNEIIAANMYLPTRLVIGDETVDGVWSYDTMVTAHFRNSDASVLLMADTLFRQNCFGLGLSDINTKIQKKIKTRFVGDLASYMRINLRSTGWLRLCLGITSIKNWVAKKSENRCLFPETISIGTRNFCRVYDEKAIAEPEGEIWNRDARIVEFSRSHAFLKKRFLNFPKEYAIYLLTDIEISAETDSNSVYFVCRVGRLHGIRVLHLVDYRFKLNRPDNFGLILKAAHRLTCQLHLEATVVRCSLPSLTPILYRHRFLIKKSGTAITCRIKWPDDYTVFVTSADSDHDFYRE